MPSTYSNIKIQLMATGENNTTWGNVTNINLGTALEEAIVGSADVTFASANVTLTLTDTNASQTARHMRLRCTGVTGGSTRNLVVPSIEKPYIVQNDCADSILVKTAAGTGITVPAGKTMWVYSDGTNVVNTTTHLSSLTLGTDLAVADGGTGASTFTANGVLLGNGTSAIQVTAVGATGQVLVGNTGAAPSWAALSGIGVTSLSFGSTGLTPATATTGAITVAGTLGVANGGTGTATAFTAGSVVFAGASGVYSQDNSNLFWDDTNNRLGIGTATPGARLETSVNSAGATVEVLRLSNPGAGANTQAQINFSTTSTSYATITGGYGAAAPQMVFNLPSGTAGNYIWQISGTERMRLDSLGNVGIATTTPTALLSVNGTTKVGEGVATNTSKLMVNTLSGVAAGIQLIQDANESWIIQNPASTNVLTFSNSGTERMRIDAAGNVGIGTTIPSSYGKLAVRGNINASTDGATLLTMRANANATDLSAYNATGAYLAFQTTPNGGGELERMRISSAGFVGINTTSPSALFHVQAGDVLLKSSSDGSNGIIRIQNTAGTTTVQSYADNNDGWLGTVEAKRMSFITGNLRRMCISSAGNVGIGTTNPSVQFVVSNASAEGYEINATGGIGGGATVSTYNRTSALYTTRTTYSSSHTWYVGTAGSTRAMDLDSSGNLGIGTSSPGAKLDVTGTTRSGNFRVNAGGSVTGAGMWGIDTILAFNTDSTERMRIDSSGNVGIGTTGSGNKLQINQTPPTNVPAAGASGHAIASGAAGYGLASGALTSGNAYLQVTRWDGTATNYNLLLQPNGGSVGIGTSAPASTLAVHTASGVAPANTSGANALRLTSTTTAAVGVGPSILFEGQTGNSTANFGFAGIQGFKTSATANDYSGALAFFTQNSGGASALSEHMRITSAGNVGIGTATPTLKLEVNGSIAVSGVGSAVTFDTTGAAQANYISTVDSFNIRMFCGRGVTSGFTAASDSARIEVNGSERMRIDSSGNVGIGTSGPAVKLDVNGAIRNASGNAGGAHFWSYTTTNVASRTWAIYNDYTVFGDFAILQSSSQTGNPTTPRMYFDASGNVGIGTTSPSYPLEVRQDGASTFNYIGSLNTTATGAFGAGFLARAGSGFSYFYMRGDGLAYVENATNNPLGFATNGAERMRITGAGDVGIGNTAPGCKLDVTGAIASSGTSSIGTNLLLSSSGVGSNIQFSRAGYQNWFMGSPNNSVDFYISEGTASTYRMYFASGGNVGIGTNSPTVYTGFTTLEIDNATNGGILSLKKAGTVVGYINGSSGMLMLAQSNDLKLTTTGSTTIQFSTNATERARIDSSGNLLVGTTSSSSTSTVDGLVLSGSTPGYVISRRASGAAQTHIIFVNGGNTVGDISSSTTTTTYSTSSDARLKENITNADSASVLIDAIKVRQFDWKADGSHQRYGMIAQELQEVAPEAVNQPADPDEMMGVDYSKLVPMLVKEIQSLRARVAQLEERK